MSDYIGRWIGYLYISIDLQQRSIGNHYEVIFLETNDLYMKFSC